MSLKDEPTKKKVSIDWLIKGTLAKAGDALDEFLGRSWQPAGSLATSEIAERLRALLDKDVRNLGAKGRFAPHVIRLRVDWEKFGSESGDLLDKLKRELTVAYVDHINDNRYHTFGPVDLEVKSDYFTKGITLSVSFGEGGGEGLELALEREEAVEEKMAEGRAEVDTEPEVEVPPTTVFVKVADKESVLTFERGSRLSVGRTRESDLVIDDPSVSRSHASMVMGDDGRLRVSDTGSTNGTFIGDERIESGPAHIVEPGTEVRFGDCAAVFEYSVEGKSE